MKNCPKCVLSSLALAIASIGLLVLQPAAAEASEIIHPVFSAAGATDAPTILRLHGSAAALELPNGEARRLALPENLRIHGAIGDAGGWWLAGQQVVEGSLTLWLGRLSLDADPAEELRAHTVPETTGKHLQELVPLVADGKLLGAGWLEGAHESALAVQAARFDEADGWGPSQLVAEPAAGTQTALAGAALLDGSSVLAWSAFDGTDDEILASRWDGDGWSAPKRVAEDNEVPDVVPAVGWVPSGKEPALTVTWSRFTPDGYTLHSARWDGEGWQSQGALTAPGTLFPSFSNLQETTLLTYRQALPRSWVIARMNADGKIEQQALVADPNALRPLTLSFDDEAVRVLPAADGAEVQRLTWEKTP
jgi:hypothetical protein